MRASKAMQDRVLNNSKIQVHWNTQAVDVFGRNFMEGLKVRNNQTGEESVINAKGLFYAIGHNPNTSLFKGQLELDEVGYIVTKPNSTETSVEGVYAAGDVQDHEYRQAITAAGSGCSAALLAERWLSANNLIQEFHQEGKIQARKTEETEETEIIEYQEKGKEEFSASETRHHGGYALRKLFHESEKLLVVKFVSPSCGPCRTLKPILNKVVDEFDGKIHFVEIDIEEDKEIAATAGVVGTPTIQIFKDKVFLHEVKGVKQKSEYRKLINNFI